MIKILIGLGLLFILIHFFWQEIDQAQAFVTVMLNIAGVPFSYCTMTAADNSLFHTHYACASFEPVKGQEIGFIVEGVVLFAPIIVPVLMIIFHARIATWWRGRHLGERIY